MAGEWKEMQWGDLITLEYGKSLRGYEKARGSVRVFGTNGPIGWTDNALCQHATVVIGRKGAYRGVHYSPLPCFVIDTAFFLDAKIEFDMRWAYYQLLTQDINSMDSGSAIPSTSRPEFYWLPVTVPPLHEQRAIACILGALDDKIELNRRMNETLEAMAQAIFKKWFIEPTKKGKLPEGWREGKVGDLCSESRVTINPREFIEELFDHYSIPAFDEGRTPKAEIGNAIKSSKFLVLNNSVLLSRLNPRIPRVWLPNLNNERRAVCSTEFFVAIPKNDISREFLFCLFSNDSFNSIYATMVTGTSGSHQRVKPESVLAMSINIPPKSTIQQFTKISMPLFANINSNLVQSRTLAALRDALLPKLLSGELRVPDAEKICARGASALGGVERCV